MGSTAGNIMLLIPTASLSFQLQLVYLHTKNNGGTLNLLDFIQQNVNEKV
jgi:hypothetical protein